MEAFLSRIPKSLLMVFLLVGGVLLIVVSDPPHNICMAQLESFKEDVGEYLFVNPAWRREKKEVFQSGFRKDIQYCRNSNSTGGCYEFFFNFKNMLRHLNTVSSECQASVGQLKEVREALWEILNLMVRIGWGGQPPKGIYDKYGWMDLSDMNLFCRIRYLSQELYPEKDWIEFRKQIMGELPGAESLNRQQIWELSLLSEDCTRF